MTTGSFMYDNSNTARRVDFSGNRVLVTYLNDITEAHNIAAYQELVTNGNILVDTAEIYVDGTYQEAVLDSPEEEQSGPLRTACGHSLITCHTDRCFIASESPMTMKRAILRLFLQVKHDFDDFFKDLEQMS